jgi:hypothetical protein
MRLTTFAFFAFMALGLFTNQSFSQTIQVPTDSKFVLSIDLQVAQSTQVGSKLLMAIQESMQDEVLKAGKKATKSIGRNSSSPSAEDAKERFSIEKLIGILGMNPLEEIQSVVVHASDFEHPEKSMSGRIRMKKNPGNIEGLLAALPGYDSTEVGAYTIHSAKPDDSLQVFGCLHQGADGNYTFYIASNQSSLVDILKASDAATASSSLKNFELEDDRKTFLSLQFTDLTGVQVGKGPQENIVKMLSGLTLSIAEEGEDIEFRSTLTAATTKKAEQLKQTVQGLVAMVEVFASMDEQDEDVRAMITQVKKIKVTQDDTKLRLRWSVPSSQFVELIEEAKRDNR